MVHLFSCLGYNIALDVYSGSVHVLDDIAYATLQECGSDIAKNESCPLSIKQKLTHRFKESEINAAYLELKKLCNENLLYSNDIYAKVATNWHKNSVVKAICLHIAHDCNMRCKYCFASTGSFNGSRSMMTKEVGKAAIDFVIKNSGNRKNIEIDYFGGEPLMNFDTVKYITDYAKAQGSIHNKNFRFTITTNGLLLNDEIKEYINENMSNVVLSLDGRKEVNDNMRLLAGGKKGSYDIIVDKFKDIANSRGQDNYYVRGTFTANNLDFAADVLHLADLGFEQTSIEPVVVPESERYAIKEEHIEKICSEYENLAIEYIKRKKEGRGFNFFHFMIDLTQGPCVIKRLSGCGSGHEYVAVTPDGDIYPCHQFVGEEEFKMGSVFEGKLDSRIKEKFEQSNVYTKADCKDCFAKFYCSGGCLANAYHFNKDINRPYKIACELERKRVECSLAIVAAMAE